MKRVLITICIILLYQKSNAQTLTSKSDPPPLPLREVIGLIKDSTNNAVVNANLILTSIKDTINVRSNSQGKFKFKKVKSAFFIITISRLGFESIVIRSFNNDDKKIIALDPITLKSRSFLLNEVTIDGTPSIIYKTDTVEYRAKDYKVREYDGIDEMLKKMPGMEVANDGLLSYQGQKVVKARLNGKDFAGGDVAQAIKNLPADIVEKIQIIDNYSDEAARTGIHDGEPTKLLNITTKPDRSIGDIVRLTSGIGNNDRYNASLFAQYINANQELGVIANFNNTQNGVAPNTGSNSNTNGGTPANRNDNGSGSGGIIKMDGSSFYYRDQWSKSIQVNTSYTYTDRTINSVNSTTGQEFSTLGTSNFVNESNGVNNSQSHAVNVEFEYAINTYDFLKISPGFNYSSSNNISNSQQSLTGLIHQAQTGTNRRVNAIPNLTGLIFFQHKFENPVRNFTIQLDLGRTNTEQSNDNDKTIRYYKDPGETVLKDSVQNYLINKNILTKSYQAVITYVEPIAYMSQLEFKGQVEYKKYNNFASVDSINSANAIIALPGLTNNYQYFFSQSHIGVDYKFDKIKYNATIGIAIIPSVLGSNLSLYKVPTHYSHINIIPIFRFQYEWSKTQRLSLSYSGKPIEPNPIQLQPFTDRSNPQNVIIGNPSLKPSFYSSLITQYNNYIPKSKLNLSSSIIASVVNDPVITNIVQIFQPILNTYINEVHYLNAGKQYSINGGYNIAKQFDDGKYILSLFGVAGYQHYTTMSNNIAGFNTTWRFNERLGVRLNPSEWLEINPYMSYDINRRFFNINQTTTAIKTTMLAIDGRMYFLKTWLVGYSARKNYINGISTDISRNPFVINAYFEKQFLRRKNLVLNLHVFDLLHQNNYINQTITANSIIYTKTNNLSRYVMLSLRLNLQKWSGTPSSNGTPMLRRNDGSFIY